MHNAQKDNSGTFDPLHVVATYTQVVNKSLTLACKNYPLTVGSSVSTQLLDVVVSSYANVQTLFDVVEHVLLTQGIQLNCVGCDINNNLPNNITKINSLPLLL